MTVALRILLIVASVLVSFYALRKIRKSQLNIDDAFYWIIVSAILLIMSIFPSVAIYLSALIGIESPANFVFLVMIFLAFVKIFDLAIELSIQKYRINKLIQKIALADHQEEKAENNESTNNSESL